jgi:hypothetical protein
LPERPAPFLNDVWNLQIGGFFLSWRPCYYASEAACGLLLGREGSRRVAGRTPAARGHGTAIEQAGFCPPAVPVEP